MKAGKLSAIEQLLKMADAHMPKFKKIIDDAESEWKRLRKVDAKIRRFQERREEYKASRHA